MPRWNNNLESNCKEVLDNKIKNVKPDLYNLLLTEIVALSLDNSKKVIEQFIRNKLNIKSTLSKHTAGYWLSRGWSANESYVRAKDNKQKNCKSVYSKEFWLAKINPATGQLFTIDEADFERNSRRPIRPEYWIKQGMSAEEAQNKAIEAKQQNNIAGAAGSKDRSPEQKRACSKRTTDYWTLRGHSPEDAAKNVSEGQRLFSLEICIAKHGPTVGKEIWDDRQRRWQDTLNSKSPEEKSRINRLKLGKGVTVSKAERTMLASIAKIVPDVIHQFTLVKDKKKQYIYDFMYNNKIIEYNGDYWHANPNIYSEDFVNSRSKRTARDIWASDNEKNQFAINHGYQVLVIWEQEFNRSPKDVIEQCIQFLNQ